MSISTTENEMDEIHQEETYREGYLKALRAFAWWKDGVEYVGCGVKTLKQAEEEFLKERKDAERNT